MATLHSSSPELSAARKLHQLMPPGDSLSDSEGSNLRSLSCVANDENVVTVGNRGKE
jgi:hypothetical protein